MKSATEVASVNQVLQSMRSTGSTVRIELSNTAKSNTGRFPPIESALMDIISNKRLDGAKKTA